MKFTLLGLDIELVLEETLQYLADMLDTKLLIRTEDQDIIHKKTKTKLFKKPLKMSFTSAWKTPGALVNAKRHHQILAGTQR